MQEPKNCWTCGHWKQCGNGFKCEKGYLELGVKDHMMAAVAGTTIGGECEDWKSTRKHADDRVMELANKLDPLITQNAKLIVGHKKLAKKYATARKNEQYLVKDRAAVWDKLEKVEKISADWGEKLGKAERFGGITEGEIDALCDIVWWARGYIEGRGENDSMASGCIQQVNDLLIKLKGIELPKD